MTGTVDSLYDFNNFTRSTNPNLNNTSEYSGEIHTLFPYTHDLQSFTSSI